MKYLDKRFLCLNIRNSLVGEVYASSERLFRPRPFFRYGRRPPAEMQKFYHVYVQDTEKRARWLIDNCIRVDVEDLADFEFGKKREIKLQYEERKQGDDPDTPDWAIIPPDAEWWKG